MGLVPPSTFLRGRGRWCAGGISFILQGQKATAPSPTDEPKLAANAQKLFVAGFQPEKQHPPSADASPIQPHSVGLL